MRWGPADRSALREVDGGVCAPHGYRAGGVAAGLKPSGAPDLALVLSDHPAGAAAVTTTNRVKAAPCLVTDRRAAAGIAQAVIINAGSANACTGERGVRDAEATTEDVARHLGVPSERVLPLSTGLIGEPLPLERLRAGLPHVVADLSADGSSRAADAIRTTDSVIKQTAVEVTDAAGRCRIGGIAKGSGMIEPALATMLVVMTTDAPMSGAVLRPLLRQAAARTFNRITVDACGSTNDTVVLLANGAERAPAGLAAFQAGLEAVCADLARQIIADGEGASRLVAVRVQGAATEDDAVALARAVCSSTLVRSALHGADPNWGRMLAAMGATTVAFDPDRVTITCGGITVCRYGVAATFDRGQAVAAMSKAEVEVVIDLGATGAEATLLTADLSPAYVAENAYYTT